MIPFESYMCIFTLQVLPQMVPRCIIIPSLVYGLLTFRLITYVSSAGDCELYSDGQV